MSTIKFIRFRPRQGDELGFRRQSDLAFKAVSLQIMKTGNPCRPSGSKRKSDPTLTRQITGIQAVVRYY